MPVSEVLEAVTVAEEVAAPGEIVGGADLTTISQQLDVLTAVEHSHLSAQLVLMGLLVGAVVALIIGRLWK